MTFEARVAAAIQVLDLIIAGQAAEKALTGWARRSRFAGAKDRAAVRDLVFDALRRKRSLSWLGGAETGRALMIGAMRSAERELAQVFSGEGYAPDALTAKELAALGDRDAMPQAVRLDVPDWIMPQLRDSLGAGFPQICETLQSRAPVCLRVNAAKADIGAAISALREDAIIAEPCDLADTALLVTQNARRVASSRAYKEGLVELQDAASQAVVAALPQARRVLDYCAGGGGKALALAARGAEVFAHDANPARMRDLPLRAQRAGVCIQQVTAAQARATQPFDLVLCDVPCSGSGAWRRSPDGKWSLTPARLDDLLNIQAGILDECVGLVAPGGSLAYVTCSILAAENVEQVVAFERRHRGWSIRSTRSLAPSAFGDGFFSAILRMH